jgi:hypothetical protein
LVEGKGVKGEEREEEEAWTPRTKARVHPRNEKEGFR